MTTRDLAKAVLAPDWTAAGSVVGRKPHEIADAIAAYEGSLVPLKDQDPKFERPPCAAIRTALRPTGAKLAPNMSTKQANAWLDGVMLSISIWPPRVALAAARAAVHEAYPFGIGDVDARIHALAEPIDARHRRALFRLRQMQAEIERAANPPTPQLEAPPEDDRPWSIDEARRCNDYILGVGLRVGFIEQDIYDQVVDERKARAATEAAVSSVEVFARTFRAIIEAERLAAERAAAAASQPASEGEETCVTS